MTWLHTWSGLVFVWLLYFVFVTGTLGYFDTEIDLWMTPEVPAQARTELLPNIAVAQARLQEVAPDSERWFIYPRQDRGNPHLSIGWLIKDPPEGESAFRRESLDPISGAPLTEARDTGGGQLLYRMHYLLHYFPARIGYYIVAVATLVMLIGLISGVVAHKKIFKDFFTFRWAKGSRSWLDAHNLLSVTTLPFQIMITYSGLLYTLGLFWMPFVLLGGYGFDMERVRGLQDIIGGDTVEAAEVAAPLLPLDTLAAGVDHEVAFVTVNFPGDRNSRVSFNPPNEGRTDVVGSTFSGVTGEPLVSESRLPLHLPGLKSGLVMLQLHQGNFADTFLRWLYFIAGIMGTAMVATGAIYWVKSRTPRKKGIKVGRGHRFVQRMNVATIVGLLTAIGAYFWANRLLPVSMENRAPWEAHWMFLVWGACFLHAAVRPMEKLWTEQLYALAGVFLLLPLVNALTSTAHLGNTLPVGDWVLAGFDLTALATGVIALIVGLKLRPQAEAVAPIPVMAQ
ncbi:MAG: PepSY-associated TM helix domain-containing protein [Pseudomonadota bacterium]